MATAPQSSKVRINLLPPAIPAARKAKKFIPVAAFLVIVSVAGTLMWVLMWAGAVKKHESVQDEATSKANEVRELQTQKTDEEGKMAPLQEMIVFLDQFETHASQYADVVEAVARYVPASCTIQSVNVTNGSASFTTVVADTEELTKLLINVNRCAMPAEGGGTEPLWSDDSVSRGRLRPLFSGPVSAQTDVAPPTEIGGILVYEPITVTITGSLSEPIEFTMPSSGVEAEPADAGGMGMPTAGAAPTGGEASGEDAEGDDDMSELEE